MNVEFVREDALLNVHGRLIQNYGGLPGLRDPNALASAIARPQHLVTYTGESSIPVLAASLPWAILRSHPFSDGNKRAALAALVMFADLNGYRMQCSDVEETAMTLRAAASQITEEEWTAWVIRSVAPASAVPHL